MRLCSWARAAGRSIPASCSVRCGGCGRCSGCPIPPRRTRFATASPPICWPAAAICAPSRNCSAMPRFLPPSATPRWMARRWPPCMTRRIRAPVEFFRGTDVKKIYLAGPDVFLPDALEAGRAKKELCRQFGFEGLFPLDLQLVEPTGTDIFRADMALMREADIGLFNLSPFRGPSADPGTVFELGMMMAMGKRVFGYRNTDSAYHQRVPEDGYMVERFGLG